MNNHPACKIVGFAAASAPTGIKERERAVRQACKEISEDSVVVIESDDASRLPNVLGCLSAGDTLVVYDLFDFGLALAASVRVCRRLERIGAGLRTVGPVGGASPLIIKPEQVAGITGLLEFADRFNRDSISVSTRRAVRQLERAGLASTGEIPYAHHRKTIRGPGGQLYKVDVWDEDECRHIRELSDRLAVGEAYESIALDFWRRKVKRASGTPFAARRRGRHVKPTTSTLRNIMGFYRKLLKNGVDLFGIPISPEAKVLRDSDPVGWERHVRILVRSRPTTREGM